MDWWHVALNIRSSSASSSSAGTSPASGTKSSSTDLFAQNLATAARTAQKSATAKNPPTKHATPAPKPAAKPASSPKPKPAAHDSDGSHSKSAAAKSSNAASKPKAAQSAQNAANAQSGGSQPDDAAAAEASANTNTAVNGAKGRAPAARAPAKNNAAQTAAAKASDAADDRTSADSTNQSGLSLIQLLAKSLERDDTDTPSTDAAAPAETDKTSADSTDQTTTDDPIAIALAMFSQALAATLSRQQAPTGNAASADAGDATTAIDSATQSPGGPASMQDLMSVLAHDVAADAKGKSDDGAAQFNVDPTKTDAANSGATDSSVVAPNALAHLGVASHFAAQHLRNDTNTADLKSPVGTPGWEDEIGTHLTWMTEKGLETGSLRVSPEHLGPVEVNISVQNGDASVWFAANHPDTRAALEQALPRLREMFANQGMNLADSGVSRQNLSQQGSRHQSRSGASQAVSGVSAVGSSDATSAARINLGLVDLYA
jgi:flagellar hook-length control protein FliK